MKSRRFVLSEIHLKMSKINEFYGAKTFIERQVVCSLCRFSIVAVGVKLIYTVEWFASLR